MTITIIITICILLLLSYLFDITASKTQIPSVILLLFLGLCVRYVTGMLGIDVPDLALVLPVLGTIGLILIVLEGSLELELNKSKRMIILKSFTVALLSILSLSFLLAFIFQYFGENTFKNNLTNAIPLCIISSAIAISSVKNLSEKNKEFVIYESSLSDILGIIFFNFIAYNPHISVHLFGELGIQFLFILLVSFTAAFGLSYLLGKIQHPIKFAPIVLIIILIYAIMELYHLPALVFILFFGLFLGNIEGMKRFQFSEIFQIIDLVNEVNRFKDMVAESAFLIRSLFFLLFGYLIKPTEIFDADTFILAAGIVVTIYLIRIVMLKTAKLPLKPLLFISPRGLITILLFLSISSEQNISIVNKSLIIQVIILTALVMMTGLMSKKKEDDTQIYL